jgi:PAS domain S-box-containing protein
MKTEYMETKTISQNNGILTRFSRTLLDILPIPVYYKDTSGRFMECNKAFEEYSGLSRENIIGKTITDLSKNEFATISSLNDTELINHPGSQSYELKVTTGIGAIKDTIFHKATLTDSQETIFGIIGTAIDVSEIRKSELISIRRANFMQSLLNTNDIPTISKLALQYLSTIIEYSSALLITLNLDESAGEYELSVSAYKDEYGELIIDAQPKKLSGDQCDKLQDMIKSGQIQFINCHNGDCQLNLANEFTERCRQDHHTTKTLVLLPLFVHSEAIGAVLFHSNSPVIKNEAIIARLQTLAADFGLAINSINTMEKLADSEETLRVMSAAAQDAIIMMGDRGKITFWNQAAEKMFGYYAAEALGKDCHALIAPQRYYEDYARAFREFSKNGTGRAIGVTLQLAGLKKNGEEFPVELSLAAAKIHNKWNSVGILRDISQREMASRNQAVLIERYLTLINSTPTPISLKDTNNRYVVVNQAICRLIGQTSDHIIGRTDLEILENETELFFREKGAQNHEEDSRILRTGEDITNGEVNYKSSNGDIVWFSITKTPFLDPDGNILGLISLFQDITEHRRSREHLIQSDKLAAIGTLAAGVAHEINNPIGYVNSNLNTMSRYLKKIGQFVQTLPNQAESEIAKINEILRDFEDAVAESVEGTARVKKIVADLKSFSRVDKAEKEHSDINEGIKSTLNIVWNELKYKCQVEQDYGELPDLYCMPNQLNQVFMNILVNAGQAIDKNPGLIKIKTWANQEYIYISFKDNGCGIKGDNVSKVFEPFFTTKDVGKGTGLGLSLSYDIIRKHGGNIEVKSEVGVGTEFIISLPTIGLGTPQS